ncbi:MULTISPECIES: hypothetical protein [Bacillaceae]|uniref:Uncharacterized protein n=1 Tax=Evansella alkalicola TaxID=745819 RepID=A0ABS6JTG1_9BACI|nr:MULTISPECIES: hypothetical protein [Bacillaceae]MBU9720959.1 hypothetical protein [Bacillus alkalicola]
MEKGKGTEMVFVVDDNELCIRRVRKQSLEAARKGNFIIYDLHNVKGTKRKVEVFQILNSVGEDNW